MATYLKGVTDYIPEVQPWSPDYNFYQNVLERKQTQYDRGWEQVNTVYNSILNAPMMRSQNIERRDNFFKNIEGQIQQMSGVDLSLAQNVDQASQVFKPFYEDPNIVKDIGFTKSYHNEMQVAEGLRNATDKSKGGGKYWEGGVRAMQYKAQEFVDANDQDAMRINPPRFTPYVNFMEKATAAVKEAGFNMVQEKDTGKWLVKTQNGQQLVGPLMDFMSSRFGDDPELTSFFKTKAYLLRKENPEAAINQFELSQMQAESRSEEEYKAKIAEKTDKKRYNEAASVINDTDTQVKSGLQQLLDRKNAIETKINNEGILPGSPEDKAYQDILASEKGKQASVESIDKVASMTNNMQYIDKDGNKISNEALDGVVANALMMREIGTAANTLAYKDYQVTMKANPYAVASHTSALAQQRDFLNHQYRTTESLVKDIRSKASIHRKMLFETKNLDPRTGLPRYTPPGTDPIQGGGMGVGDPADIAAKMDQYIAMGYPPAMAVQMARSEFSGVSSNGGSGKTLKLNESSEEPGYAVPLAEAPKAGVTSQEDIKMTTDSANADTRVQNAIEAASPGPRQTDKSGTGLMVATNNFVAEKASIIENWRKEGKDFQNQFTERKVNALLDIASDPTNPYYEKAKNMMIGIGDAMLANEKKGGREINDLKMSGVWSQHFSDFPNSNNSLGYNPDAIKKLASSNLGRALMEAAGADVLYDAFSNKNPKVVIPSYNDGQLVDPASENIVSKREYENLLMRSAPMPGVPVKPLSADEIDAIKKYEYVTSAPRLSNMGADFGLGSDIPDLGFTSFDELTQIGFSNMRIDAADRSKNNFVNQMTEAKRVFTVAADEEGAGVVDKFVRKNVWEDRKNNGYGGLTSLGTIYKRVAHLDDETIDAYHKENYSGASGMLNAIGEGFAGGRYQGSIPELEQEYLYGKEQFDNKGMKNMLANSELVIDYPLPSNLDQDALWQNAKQKPVPGRDPNQAASPYPLPGMQSKDFSSTGKAATWRALIKDPNTKIVRQGNNVTIDSPYLKGSLPVAYDLNAIETSNIYDEIFQEVYDKAGTARADFMNTAQNVGGKNPGKYLSFPGDFGVNNGNFNYVAPTMSNVRVQAGLPTQAHEEVKPLLQEIENNLNEDLSQYGFTGQQGSADLLKLANFSLANPEKQDRDNPLYHVNITPVYGNSKISKVDIEMDPANRQQYIEKRKLGISGVKLPDGGYSHGSTIPTKGTYYVYNSQSDIIKKQQPDPYYTLVGLSEGEPYNDTSLMEEIGGQVSYQKVGDKIKITPTFKYYDYETQGYRTQTLDDKLVPLKGTNWKTQFEEEYYNLYLIYKDLDDRKKQAKSNDEMITNTDHYQQKQ